MLSILIPIYNQDVRPLVYALHKQCTKLNIAFQILCFDDCSEERYKKCNQELAFLINVNYTEMTENLGRSRIRNWLGRAAYHPYLLFLDGDSTVKNRNFIKNYLPHLRQDVVIYGGRLYAPKPPRSKKKRLHWKYGTKREALKAKERNKNPFLNFQSNNFIIPESLFSKITFDTQVKGYGYEDLLYGFELKNHNVKVVHIDNPIFHDGVEETEVFLEKTQNGINNLVQLYQKKEIPYTRLTKMYERLISFDAKKLFLFFYEKWSTKIYANLRSENPSVFYFNIWKLYTFIKKYDELNQKK